MARTKRLTIAAGLTALCTALTMITAVPTARAKAGTECAATTIDWTARAERSEPLSSRFTEFADSADRSSWTGADSTYSVRLRGKRVWIFSDTFLGPVNADGSRPTDAPFLNNSFVVQRGSRLSTVTGGTPEQPESLVGPTEDGAWWWFGAGAANPVHSSLDVMALQFARTGSGNLDFAWQRTAIARFDARTLRLRELIPVPSGADVQWSSWIRRDGGHTYIYGTEDRGAEKFMHIARLRGVDLDRRWEFWTGSGWSADEQDSSRVMVGVANEYSVTKFADGYLLTTHDTTELFSPRIMGYFSCTPTGPFTNRTELYRTPETGALGSYGNPNVWTYNSHEHPDLRSGNRLLISYNVNSFDPNNDLYADVTIYRPRFVDITLEPESH
jgi:hypothetical protein